MIWARITARKRLTLNAHHVHISSLYPRRDSSTFESCIRGNIICYGLQSRSITFIAHRRRERRRRLFSTDFPHTNPVYSLSLTRRVWPVVMCPFSDNLGGHGCLFRMILTNCTSNFIRLICAVSINVSTGAWASQAAHICYLQQPIQLATTGAVRARRQKMGIFWIGSETRTLVLNIARRRGGQH